MVSTVWSVSCLLFFYSRCPPCPAIRKSGGHVPPCSMESAPLVIYITGAAHCHIGGILTINKDCVTRGNLTFLLPRLITERAFRLACNRHTSIANVILLQRRIPPTWRLLLLLLTELRHCHPCICNLQCGVTWCVHELFRVCIMYTPPEEVGGGGRPVGLKLVGRAADLPFVVSSVLVQSISLLREVTVYIVDRQLHKTRRFIFMCQFLFELGT